MATYPSIYDLVPTFLTRYDWSRPLLVQAAGDRWFREAIEVLTERLSLGAQVTQLTTASCQAAGGRPGRTLVNPEPAVSARTPTLVAEIAQTPYSVVVVVSDGPVHDTYLAMCDHSHVACFCHALDHSPIVMVGGSGHLLGSYEGFFNLRERQVGPHRIFGSIILSDREIGTLFQAGLDRPDGAVVEIGRFSGGSAMVLARAGADRGRRGVVSIDIRRVPIVEYLLAVNAFTSEDVALIDADAFEVAMRWGSTRSDAGIGLLFIDADHSYQAVVRDLHMWTPYLVPGALVAFHDVSLPAFGVTRAVYEYVYRNPAFDSFQQADSLVVARFTGRGGDALRHRDVAPRRVELSLEPDAATAP